MYQVLQYLHIFGTVLFFISHGATALAMFRVRDHRHPEAIRALMSLRATQLWGFGVGFLLMGLSAIALGIMNGLWGQFWMWGSTVIFFIIWAMMGFWGREYYEAIEMALDPEGEKAKKAKKPETRSLDEVIDSGRPVLLAWIGIGGTAIIMWLMMYKPF
jgi:hypothetical protein